MRILLLLALLAALCGITLASTAGDGFVAVPDGEVAGLRGGACFQIIGTWCGIESHTEHCRLTPVFMFGLPTPFCAHVIDTVQCTDDESAGCGMCFKVGCACIMSM